MTWLVFGVSCLLVLAGAVSIISGAPIVQLERGWAEVISGTVALSSGGVVFALAVVLVRLEALRDSVAARAGAAMTAPEGVGVQDLAPAPPAAVAEPLAKPHDPAPDLAPPSPALESEAPPGPVPQTEHGLWKRIKRPAETSDPNQMEQQGFPDRVVPDQMPDAVRAAATAPVIVPPHDPAAPPGNEATPAIEPAATTTDTGQIGWLERSLAKGRTTRPEPVERPGPSLNEPLVPSLFGARSQERLEPSMGTGLAPASPPTLEPAPTPDLAAERHEGTSVIGRYQAGSSSYVMYSDGTIEVETEDGQVHRFGSMDELKAYIASQESPAN